MSLHRRLLSWLWPSERRRARRKPTRGLAAYYWNGAEPEPRRVKNLSVEGMYLVTEERWYPNTLICMTLTRTDSEPDDALHSVKVVARVVRSESDGVGLSFVFTPAGAQPDELSENVASRQMINRFVDVLERGAVPLKSVSVSVGELRSSLSTETVAGK